MHLRENYFRLSQTISFLVEINRGTVDSSWVTLSGWRRVSLKRPDVVGARSYVDDLQTLSKSIGGQLFRSATVATTEARACNANRKSALRSLRFIVYDFRERLLFISSLIIRASPEIIALLTHLLRDRFSK